MSTAESTAVAVVTGGESGIGRACVEILRERGSAVYVIDQAAENPISVQDEEALARLAERVRREHGGVNVLINSAGIVGANRPFEEYSAADFQRLIDVNLLGTVAVCHAFAARLREGRGAVVNLSSQAGLVSLPDQSAYSASKGAVVALTRSLAIEWGKHGVRVNAVAPGVVITPMTEEFRRSEPLVAAVHKRVALGRMLEAREIAEAVVFLASPAASAITGVTLAVDGGWTAGEPGLPW